MTRIRSIVQIFMTRNICEHPKTTKTKKTAAEAESEGEEGSGGEVEVKKTFCVTVI